MKCAKCGAQFELSTGGCPACGQRILSLEPKDEPELGEPDLTSATSHANNTDDFFSVDEAASIVERSKNAVFATPVTKHQNTSDSPEQQAQRVELFRKALLQELGTFKPFKILVGSSISAFRRKHAYSALDVDVTEPLLGLIDTTFFGRITSGLVFGLKGIYWKNPSVGKGRSQSLSWERLAGLIDAASLEKNQLVLTPVNRIELKQSKKNMQQFKNLLQALVRVYYQHTLAYRDIMQRRYTMESQESALSHWGLSDIFLSKNLWISVFVLVVAYTYSKTFSPPIQVQMDAEPMVIDNINLVDHNVCHAAIAKVLLLKPRWLREEQGISGESHFSFIDGQTQKRETFKCKVNNGQIQWGNKGGRWRDSEYDSKLSFKFETPRRLIVSETQANGNQSSQLFLLIEH